MYGTGPYLVAMTFDFPSKGDPMKSLTIHHANKVDSMLAVT